MSSFRSPHHLYLFSLKDGKKKLAYGESPQDALEILRIRLTYEEMEEIIEDDFIRIRQRDLQKHFDQLG